ncbi:MAG: hypothetical protein JNL14_14745 [Devosia sp.]|uniref:hypothetical protein n=1 Tax=Devosia sp. TaxID=1871048 RepID=UPI001A5D38F0|nr:hypothetical protein [Devosia sp.]MBL8598990.1 hypothetical protein [Devosia sp.]
MEDRADQITKQVRIISDFNLKIAELVKSASPTDLIEILGDQRSLISAKHNNQNQNGRLIE